MPGATPFSTDNLCRRLRVPRVKGEKTTWHAVRLDTEAEAALNTLQAEFINPSDPLDKVNASAVMRRALKYYREHALSTPEIRTIEFSKLRYGSIMPVRRNRYRNKPASTTNTAGN